MRALLVAVVALAVLAPSALAGSGMQDPPKLPNSTAGTKKCRTASRYGASFRVYIVRGARRISCRRARRVVAYKPPFDVPHWTYFDWTKGGNGPWSDVYRRNDRRVVIGAIMRG